MPRTRSHTVAASPAAAVETVIASLVGMAVPASGVVDIEGSVDITIGTAGTAVTLKIRRGTDTTGATIVTYGPFTATAGNRNNYTVNVDDSQAGEISNGNYVLTATVTAATAASTVNAVYLNAIW